MRPGLTRSDFRPPRWLTNPHLQTLWASKGRRRVHVPLRWEVVELPDGDFVEVAWHVGSHRPETPTVLLLHGLGGSVDSRYIRGLMKVFHRRGWRVGCFHFRGCGRAPNRTPIGYHSGQSADPRHVLHQLRQRWPGAPLAAIGFSLGANVLLKLLGEDGPRSPVDAAVAVSPPLVLARCADRMERGMSRLYQRHLLKALRRYVRSKPSTLSPDTLDSLRTFREFDDHVTAPLHGFDDSADYYARASCRPFLRHIEVPTLVVHANDDPFFAPDVVPDPSELSDTVQFELSAHGGHVAFVEGHGRYYIERRAPAFLGAALQEPVPKHAD